jgi:hypothetical protein
MAASDSLLAHVPYLRRFSCALTGSQAVGDACVVAALEAILAGKISPHTPARMVLYRSLLEQVSARNLDEVGSQPSRDELEPVQRNLAVLMPMARQAFLLVAMWRNSASMKPRRY